VMDKAKLKLHAGLLEEAIRLHAGKHNDVDFLSTYQPLIDALADAKDGKVETPRKMGLARWEMDSNIRDVSDVAHRLAQFELLLEGWTLPSEQLS
jgi:hypothetical protein